MKRITSIILLITIISSCLAVSGCELFGGQVTTTDGEQTTTTTTTSSTTSTTTQMPPDKPETIEFEHGDNFTEDNIEFVRSFHDYLVPSCSEPFLYTFSNMVYYVNRDPFPHNLFYVSVDMDNPYYICGYIDLSVEEAFYRWGAMHIYATDYVWYKFEDKEAIPETIGDLSLGVAFHIYDAIITKDIGKGIDCEHRFHYYELSFHGVRDVEWIAEYIVLPYSLSIEHLVNRDAGSLFRWTTYYEGYTASNGKRYLLLPYCSTLETDGSITDGLFENKKKLEDYYDVLYPYFERVEELDFDYTNAEGEVVKALHYGIDIDTLYEVLFIKE